MIEVEVYTQQYVNFVKETGEIFSIAPEIDSNYETIKISQEEADKFKTFQERIIDYRVLYHKQQKQFMLRKNTTDLGASPFKKVSPLDKNSFYDVELVIDKPNNLCYINTDADILKTISDRELAFSITYEDDPHILYEYVTFRIDSVEKKTVNITGNYSVYTNSDYVDCVYREIYET